MAPPRKRLQLHRHKTSWDFDWRNPDMKVLRRPILRDQFSIQEIGSRVVDAEESNSICQGSLNQSGAPEWFEDESYNWGKQSRLVRKRRRKEHRAALAAAKGGEDD